MINGAQALAALEKAVATKGAEYVYTDAKTGIRAGTDEWDDLNLACRYADKDGNPACIVGTALALDFPEEFERWREREVEEGTFSIKDGNLALATFDPDAAEVVMCAQRRQDSGARWGKALELARKAVVDPNA